MKYILSILFATVLFNSVFVQRNKHSFYRYHITKSKVNNLPVVYGTIYAADGLKERLGGNGAIKIGNEIKAKTNSKGDFLFKLSPGQYKFTGIGLPYKNYTTKPIDVSLGDTLKLDMYLMTTNEQID